MMGLSTVFRRITAIYTCSLIVFSAYFGTLYIYGPVMPLMLIWPKLYRRSIEIVASWWQSVLVAVNEKIFGINMVYTGDGVQRHEKTVLLLNHRTRLDWFFFFSYIFHSSILNRHKISLKDMLKWFPGIGWGMQTSGYIFLKRNWENDKDHIKKILKYQMDLGSKPNILLFPEGTDLTENTMTRSNAFARKHNLQEYKFVLQPRTKGFCFFVNTLREIGGIDSVHDVTIGYPYNIAQGEKELLRGDVPQQVNFHLVKHDINKIPKDEEELSKWIQKRWKEKEARLEKFYSEKDPSKRSFSPQKCSNIQPRTFLLWLAFIFWNIVTFLGFYLLVVSPFARFYSALLTLYYIACTYFFGGVEKVEMLLYEQFFKPSRLWAIPPHGTGGGCDGNPYDRYLKQH